MELIARHEPCSAAEWPSSLDVRLLRDQGWQPRPFRQFVVKIHSRCNLACDYCYVYRSADQSWRDQPPLMSDETVRMTAERIAAHASTHGLPRVRVTLHGGEPLLAGGRSIAHIVGTIRSAAGRHGVEVDVSVQTNGTLLDESLLEVLAEHAVRVSISFDGSPEAHDAHRVRPGGRGTYHDLVRGISLMQDRHPELFAGLLCVVDPRSDPVATFENLLRFRPPTIDFLLPHANWSSPPSRPGGTSDVAYGDWLVRAYDRWYDAPARETSVRYFDEIIRGVLGHPSRVETIGLSPAALLVIETDGSIEQVDALKTAYEGAARTGLDVHRHDFDMALDLPQIAARQIGVEALGDTCRRCDVHRICGAGFYPHRYRPGSGFRNPSVYCADLQHLIRHVRTRVQEGVASLRADMIGTGAG